MSHDRTPPRPALPLRLPAPRSNRMATKKTSKKQATQNVFIRTVTCYYTGEVLEQTEHEIVLVNAAWIADTGRFAQAMLTGVFNEVEPYPDDFEVCVSRGSITDFVRNWPHPLPRVQK